MARDAAKGNEDAAKFPYNARARKDRRKKTGPSGKTNKRRKVWFQKPGEIINDGRRLKSEKK